MNVCSFVPSATNLVYEMGLEDHLDGVTYECASDKPQIIRGHLEGNSYSSEEIDRIVSEYANMGRSLHYADMELLEEIAPDLVFTQEVCDVCSVSSSVVEKAVGSLKKRPKVVPLTPSRLRDIYQDALTVATELGEEKVGLDHLAKLEKRVQGVTDKLREHQAAPRRAMIIEWLDPIINAGNWIPDQVALAGGTDLLANPGGDSIVMPWEKIKMYDPEVLVIAPCGFEVERSLEEMEKLTSQPGWKDLTAVKNGEVYLTNSHFFTRPSTTVVDGIELLASLFHPHLFDIPKKSKDKVIPITDRPVLV